MNMNSYARLLAPPTKWVFCLLAALSLLGAPYQAPKGAKSKAPAANSSATSAKLIDINSASADELKSLAGIGDAYSAAIIKNRPYANKRQLLSKSVVPQATYDKISDRIIAKQAKGK